MDSKKIKFCCIIFIMLLILPINSVLSDDVDNFTLGKTEYLLGHFHYAELYLSQAIEENPDLEEAYFYLGCIYDEQGKYDLAIDMFNIGKDLSNFPEIYWYNMGQVYRRAGEYDRAIESFNQVLTLTNGYPEAYLHLGMTYYLDQDRENTIESWETYQSLSPSNMQYDSIEGALAYLRSDDFVWDDEVVSDDGVIVLNNGAPCDENCDENCGDGCENSNPDVVITGPTNEDQREFEALDIESGEYNLGERSTMEGSEYSDIER